MAFITDISQNLNAFLDMIAFSEGTSSVKDSDSGYNVIVGGKLFTSYEDHPRQLVHVRPGLSSTAAGRYQLLARYFDFYNSLLCLGDFSPVSQDKIAIQQLKEVFALDPIEKGDVVNAIKKCSHIWASLPGNEYGQRQNSLIALEEHFTKSGGSLLV